MTTGRSIRWLFYAAVAAFETTLGFLASVFLTSFLPANPARWLVLLVVVLAAAATSSRWQAVGSDGAGRAVWFVGAAVVLWACKVQLSGDLLPWSHLGQLALIPGSVAGYFTLLVTWWCWWRGLGLFDQDHSRLLRLLRRAVVVFTVAGCFLPLAGQLDTHSTNYQELLISVVCMLALGLICLVLARISDDSDIALVTDHWRWLRSGVATTSAIILVGLIVLAVFSPSFSAVLHEAVMWGIWLLSVLAIPFVWVAYFLLSWIPALDMKPLPSLMPPTPQATQPEQDTSQLAAASSALATVQFYVMALVPIIILIALVLFFNRRRNRLMVRDDEEHESLFSWAALRQDLRSLFDRAQSGGLRRLLDTLRSSDPVTRIRRRYVQALLLGEDAEHARLPAQTPSEYQPVLGTVLPGRNDAVQALTAVYQRARYAPQITKSSDADLADAAWQQFGAKE